MRLIAITLMTNVGFLTMVTVVEDSGVLFGGISTFVGVIILIVGMYFACVTLIND